MIGINILHAVSTEAFAKNIRPSKTHIPKEIQELFSQPTPEGRNPLIYAECIKPFADYPVRVHHNDHFHWVLEGCIYNQTLQEIESKLQQCFAGGNPDLHRLKLLTSSFSGEYLIIVRLPFSIYLINDSLGRLPLYTGTFRGMTYYGRSLYWLHQHTKLTLDKTSVFEYLWSSYPLHFKTLYQNVFRCKGGSITKIDLQNQTITTVEGTIFNFDERNDSDVKFNSKKVASLFLEANYQIVKNANAEQINLSLSGGQDSRAVAFGLNHVKANVTSSSFLYPGAEHDVTVAAKVAAFFNIPWKKYTVSRSVEADDELLTMKMGQNYLGLSFLLDYFKQLQHDQPAGSLFITGDGGDKILPYLGETNADISFDQLVRKIANRHTIIPVAILSRLLSWTEEEFLHHLSGILKSYPEMTPNNKSIHFTMYEKTHQSFFEGEDRNRHFFWSTTPFYDINLFQFAMKIPDHQKRYYRLYRHFMNQLSPSLAALPDDTGISINHPKFAARKIFHEFFRATSPEVKSLIKKITGHKAFVTPQEVTSRQGCFELIRKNPDLLSWIDTDQLSALLRTATKDQFAYVFTLSQLAKVI